MTLVLPPKSKRRSLVDENELKIVKKRLKKAEATPKKVAEAINADPSLDFTTSRSTIIRRMNLGKRKREESKNISFLTSVFFSFAFFIKMNRSNTAPEKSPRLPLLKSAMQKSA